MIETPEPYLTKAQEGPLYPVEELLLNRIADIEAWFRGRWQETPAPITSSVDLRNAGFKLSPVDTNLFPAGFNNLNKNFFPLCIQAAQSVLSSKPNSCTKILLLPESHTRNTFYFQSLKVLQDIFLKAGFIVRIGSLNPALTQPMTVQTETGHPLLIEPLIRKGSRIGLENFDPCLILLNNDLSEGVPDILQNLDQIIRPSANLGWDSRLKSDHFNFFTQVCEEFSALVDFDPWLINPLFKAVEGIDFMAQEGIGAIAEATDGLLHQIQEKYNSYGIKETPFVAVKADNGTYGMSVMMVKGGNEILQLNRKQRTKMSASKGSRKVDKVIIQEGVHTFETMPNGAVAEPVIYMIGEYVVGGFYRVHQGRGVDENLNAPGMHFEPLAFAHPCNMPREDLAIVDCPNRFYVYSVIARLAALAAALEIAATNGMRK